MSALDELLASAEAKMYPNYRQPPLIMTHGDGVYLWDSSGKRYLDFFAGIAVSTLGHNHPRLTRAVSEQAAKLLHISNYYYNEPNIRLAERLCTLTGFDRVLFCNSGTEANEAMLKLTRRHFYARGVTERYRIIAFENSFHGRTLGALSLTGQGKYRDGFGPLSGVTHVPFGDAAAVEAAMGPDVAGVWVEPIQGEGGVRPAPPGFLAELRAITERHGALLLADEVQTGVGRTGKFLGFEHANVRPDAIALAKALGGGVPIGAVLCREELSGALPPGSHGSTFGGNPLASAAAVAVLDELDEQDLIAATEHKGRFLARRLAELAKQHSQVECSRGQGLLQALVLRDGTDGRGVVERCRQAGVLLTLAGGTALRFTPPLTITEDELDNGLNLISQVLDAAQ